MKSKSMQRRIAIGAILLVAVLLVSVYALAFWPLRDPHPSLIPGRGALAIRGAKLYISPDAAPLEQATIVVQDG